MINFKKASIHVLSVLLLLALFTGSSFAAHTITNWPDNKAGAVSLTFDDSHPSQISLGIPALDARGMKGTFFVITNNVAGDWTPWKNASITGHEIGSHTISHPYLTSLTPSQVQVELQGSQSIIDSQVTTQKAVTIAYPYGDYNSSVQSIAQNYYIAARGVNCGLNQDPIDFYGIKACSPDSLDDVYAQTDAAQAQGKWMVFFIHSLDGTGYGEWLIGDLENYLDYLMTKNLWVGTFGSMVKYIKERQSANLYVSSSTADRIVLNLTDTLDDAIYGEPLTIRSEIPAGWSNVTVLQGDSSTTVASALEGGVRVIYYHAIPDRGPISLLGDASDPFLEDGTGLVSMEAEHYQTNVTAGGYAWMPVANAGYSGTGALRVLPNDEPNPLPAGSGPRLDYQVQFTSTGTHYIWMRALAGSSASDSVYVGLDGVSITSGSSLTGLVLDGLTWTWTNKTGTGAVVSAQRNIPRFAHDQRVDARIGHRAGQAGVDLQLQLRSHRHGAGGESRNDHPPSDGGDERGLVGDHDRWGLERGSEPERAGDERLVRMGHQSDAGQLQQHVHAVVGIRDDEPGGLRDAVGADRRDDVLLPGGGLQLRGDVEGVDRQLHHIAGRRCSDGGDERGLVGDHDRWGLERGREPERAGDEWVVRMGHQSDAGQLQQHFHAVVGIRDDEPGGLRDAVGAYLRDDVLLPGGGLQLRGDVEGVDRQFLSGRTGRVSAGRDGAGFHGIGALSIQCSLGWLRLDARCECRLFRHRGSPGPAQRRTESIAGGVGSPAGLPGAVCAYGHALRVDPGVGVFRGIRLPARGAGRRDVGCCDHGRADTRTV